MTEWRDAGTDLPQWEHAGEDIEAVLDDGRTVIGWLDCEDIDDGEEGWPLFAIAVEGVGEVYFTHAVKWRLLTRS